MRSFALVVAALALATASSHVLMETDINVGAEATLDWNMGERAQSHEELTVYAMMRHEEADVKKLEEVFYAVSDPTHSEYGNHLTNEEIEKITPISDDKLKAVRAFFSNAKSVTMTPNKDILEVVLTVAEAEQLFSTEINRFHHKRKQGMSLLRAAKQYSVPQEVADAVYLIGDLVNLPRVRESVTANTQLVGGSGTWPNACTGLSGCKGLITPQVLKQRYNVPNDTTGMTAAGNSMSVAEFQGQYFIPSDIAKFSSGCGVNATVDTVVGGNNPSAGVEAELDIEYIKGVSPGIPLTVIYASQYSLLNWATQLQAMANPPLVNSVSYGNDEKQQTSTAYMLSCNVQFMKAGTKGLSILFASGDQGVCGREGCGIFTKRFKPDFPGGSPYITVVGGTDFSTFSIGEETAWSAGGGGFSDTFAIPDYQAKLVAAYKASPDAKLPKQSEWNNTGRGYPDVAALGGQKTPYCVVTSGTPQGVAGTSASCPTTASVFARLNGLRLAKGGKPMGFLNPWIYQNPDAFNDVTSGCNNGGGFNKDCFTAIKGWDAATGNGTPNFAIMKTRI